MTLVLRIESTDSRNSAVAPRDGWVRTEDNLSIGRAVGNGLVLEDPSNTISKQHCVIERGEQGFAILDTSRNGTFLNGRMEPLSRETPTLLNLGDVIRVGSFDLHVVSVDQRVQVQDVARPALGVAGPASPEEAALLGPVVPRVVSDALLAKFDPRARRDRPEERLVIEADSFEPVIEADSFEPVSVALSDPAAPGSVRRIDVDLFAEPSRASAYADGTPEPQMAFVQPKVRIEPIPDDWDLMEEIGHRRTPLAVPIETSPPEDIPVPLVSEANPAPARAGTPRDDEAIGAFLQACGLGPEDLRAGDLVPIMQRAGAMLRASVENLQALLETRATARPPLSPERTMIGRTGNNPLKFIPDSHDALVAMLLANIPGFLAAESAVAQAFADLRSHHESLIRAPRDAVMEVCDKLSPETIEAQVTSAGTFGDWLKDRLMLERTSSRLWHAYKATFDGVVAEVDDRPTRVDTVFAIGHRSEGAPRDAEADRDEQGGADAYLGRLGDGLVRC